MSNVLINQDTMEDIGDSIRSKLGVQTTYLPSEMPSAIMSISGGGGDTLVIQDAIIYSEDEQQVGVWTDGKPLYQKTINFTEVSISANRWISLIDLSSLNIESIPYAIVSRHRNGSVIPFYSYYTRIDNGVFYIYSSMGDWVADCLTLQYTKTTDAAGSGGYKAYGLSPIIYSEEEREVGVWTDGKPLYQKTVSFNVNSNYNTIQTLAHGISDIDNVNITEYFVRQSNGTIIPNGFYFDTSYALSVYAPNKTNVSVRYAWGTTAGTLYATLQYTKTTDTAGSGIWTTTGEYAHHYSTDEKVVGTWIDGSTIYERTLTFSTPISTSSANSSVSTAITLASMSIDKLIKGQAFDIARQCYPATLLTKDNETYLGFALGYDNRRITALTIQYTKTT